MSVLDQAFIRAFAKDRSAIEPALHNDSKSAAETEPSSGDRGGPLVLHDMFTRGDQLRFDVEAHVASSQSSASPAAHVVFGIEPPEATESGAADEPTPAAPCEMNDRTAVLDDAGPPEPAVATSESASDQQWIELSCVEVSDLERPLVLLVPDENPACRPALNEIGRQDLVVPAWVSYRDGPVQRLGIMALVHVGAIEDSRVVEYLNGAAAEPDHRAPAALPAIAVASELPGDSQDKPDEPSTTTGSMNSADLTDERSSDGSEEVVPSAWEVDRFNWPQLCRQLDQASEGDLQGAGQQLISAAQDGLSVLAVTGTHRQEGRTTLALSLAASAADAGGRVALLDADTTTPDLAVRLGVDAPCDWLAVVRQHHPVLEAGVASLEDKITLFPLASPTNVQIDSNLFASVLDQLRRHFDLIVIDMPPVTADDIGFLRGAPTCPVNMALVVHNPAVTTQAQTIDAATRLREFGIDAIGIAENGIVREPRVA